MDFISLQDLFEADVPYSNTDRAGKQPPINSPDSFDSDSPNPSANMKMDDQKYGKDQMSLQMNKGNVYPQKKEDEDIDFPDMPDEMGEKNKKKDFETWKKDYFNMSIKGDTKEMIMSLSEIREGRNLESYQKKFIEDNYNIQILRKLSNIEQASNEIRKKIKQNINKHHPSATIIENLVSSLESIPLLSEIMIKLDGYKAMKGDLHRKYIASLLGAVQVGAGGENEDIIFNERDYSVFMSTRYNSRWGDVFIGAWALKEDDPEKFLTKPEIKRLEDGSPEERDIMRRRVVLESIADTFDKRSFIINVVNDDGTIYNLGWDIGNSLRSSYKKGKLVVRTIKSDNSEAFITDDGDIVPFIDLNVYYVYETNEVGPDGNYKKIEKKFIDRKNGVLFLTADFKTIKEASRTLSGMKLSEVPYRGNPSDLEGIRRCVYSAYDLLTRQCQ